MARADHDLVELLTADYSFLNERLAAYYGIEGVSGGEMRRVALPPGSHRGGLLTHGSLLISTSNPNRTSPVKRGVFVLENLLGKEVPPPPPNVGNLEDAHREGREPKTIRDRLALHREKAACSACHAHFDPVGLALENYGNLGQWRMQDAGEPVDPNTTLVTGESIAGAADLSRSLAARKDLFYRCLTEKLLTYRARPWSGADRRRHRRPDRRPAFGRGGQILHAPLGRDRERAVPDTSGRLGPDPVPEAGALPVPPPPEKRKGPVRKKFANRQQPPAKTERVEKP